MANSAQRIQFLVSQEDGFTKARLPALYSDFRGLKSTNPEGYAANVAAWRQALASLVRHGMLPAASGPVKKTSKSTTTTTTTASAASAASATRDYLVLHAGPQLLDALESDRYGRPLALDAAVREAAQDRAFVPLSAFLTSRESIYSQPSWAAWAASSLRPWNVVSWGLQQLGVGGSSHGSIPATSFVVVRNVEAAAAAFAEQTAELNDVRSSPFQRTWSTAQFKRQFGQPGAVFDQERLSDSDLDALLVFLARDKQALAFDGDIVRLGKGVQPIDEQDRAVAQLRELIDGLHHQTTVLAAQSDALRTEAKEALAVRHSRVAAQAALKRRHAVDAALTARYASLAQLEALQNKIEQAADQVAAVHAMEAGAAALASLHAQTGGVDRVEAVVDRLRDEMDAVDEIGQILADETVSGTIDETEIEDELAALEKQEKEKEEKAEKAEKEKADKADQKDKKEEETLQQRLDAIGNVPETTPGSKTTTTTADEALEAAMTESLRSLSLKEAQ